MLQDDYPVRELPTVERFKPKEAIKSSEPFDGSSTYVNTYQAYPIAPRAPRKAPSFKGEKILQPKAILAPSTSSLFCKLGKREGDRKQRHGLL